jgi:hypothetical protein
MKSSVHVKTVIPLILITVAFACVGFLTPNAFGVVPPPDGGYPGFNTAEGQRALFSLTTGQGNTAVGWFTLESLATGNFNTAIGAAALVLNTGDQNTATGTGALFLNTTGFGSTANGAFALFNNTTGLVNTATGLDALFSNTTGSNNTADGEEALESNTTGNHNAAFGSSAMRSNTIGNENIGLGSFAGVNLTTGDRNIDIGNQGVANESSTIRIGADQSRTFIAGIRGVLVADSVPVVIDPAGQFGTIGGSSRRLKDHIKPMDKASEDILALKPVAFHYKSDHTNTPQFGLIAEQVAAVNADLVVRDENGEIYAVRYDAVNAMLLNEFLKEHCKVEQQAGEMQEQKATIAELKSIAAKQEKGMEALAAHIREQDSRIQTVCVGVRMSRPVTQVATNDH